MINEKSLKIYENSDLKNKIDYLIKVIQERNKA